MAIVLPLPYALWSRFGYMSGMFIGSLGEPVFPGLRHLGSIKRSDKNPAHIVIGATKYEAEVERKQREWMKKKGIE